MADPKNVLTLRSRGQGLELGLWMDYRRGLRVDMTGLWRDSLHVNCGLTACTPGSSPGPTLGRPNEYMRSYLGRTLPVHA